MFCHLKIVSGDVNARKWSVKWRNWSISLSSIDGRKQRRRPETFASRMRTIHRTEHDKKMLSLFKEDRFDISDSPRSGRPSRFEEDRLIHIDPRQCTRELANAMNCNHSTIVRHLHSMSKVQKSGV